MWVALGFELYAFLSFAGRRAIELMGSAAPRLGGGGHCWRVVGVTGSAGSCDVASLACSVVSSVRYIGLVIKT